jgi:glycosyltransferase involved in cell wall biosynthesis
MDVSPRFKISVIIPLYDGARFIAQALDSVFSQSIGPTEVLVVDDGSTDDGPDIVARYAATRELTLLRKPNGGQSSARNFGVRCSHGNLIALLDQDDIWYPDHLSELQKPFLEDPYNTLGWTYSNLDEIDAEGHLTARAALSNSSGIHPKMRLNECIRQDMFVLPSASMISRAAFEAVGGFDEQLSGYEDDDLFLRLFAAGYRNVYIEQPLARWRIYASSTSYSPRMARSRMVYARKLLRSFPDEPMLSRFPARDLIAPRFLHQLVEETRVALRRGDPEIIEACVQDIAFLDSYVSPDKKVFPVRADLLITAIVPLYNGARFIREALRSIIDQELVPDEVIVVDDGSTDDGAAIVAEVAKQYPIRLLRKENGGQSSARNMGVDHAHGDLIAFLDQDDAWHPNHLTELVKPFLETRSIELGWVYSSLDEINEAGEMVAHDILKPFKSAHPKRDLACCLREDMFILPSASLISREAFRRVGGFDERLSGYEDDDFFLRMFLAGFDNVYLPTSLSKWRIYQTSSSYSQRMAVSRAIYARKLIERFPNDHDRGRHHVRDMIAPRFFQTMAGEMRKATLKGTRPQQATALANLEFIVSHIRLSERLLLQLFFLPALRVPPLAHFIMRHRIGLYRLLRRLL